MSRPEFKSSRKLKRGLNFNDFIILVIDLLYGNLAYQWPLCPALRPVVKGLLLWMEKQTSCLEECPHLVVLFDSIAGLCFYKTDHFLSLYNQCVYIDFQCPTLHTNNWHNWLHRLMETSSKAVESSWDRQIASVYLTPKIQDLKYRSKHVPMRGRINKQNRK